MPQHDEDWFNGVRGAGKRVALRQRRRMLSAHGSADRLACHFSTAGLRSRKGIQALALIFRFNPRRCIEAERCQIGNRAKAPAAGRGKIKGAGLKDQAARETWRNRTATCGPRNERACRRGGAGGRKQPAA